ncbi:hypothetical protein GCM10020331_021210 [Ectobacillus funiculus]
MAVVTVYSVNMDSSFTSHIEIGLKQVPYYLHIPFQIGIPVLLLVITWGKKLGKKAFSRKDYIKKNSPIGEPCSWAKTKA